MSFFTEMILVSMWFYIVFIMKNLYVQQRIFNDSLSKFNDSLSKEVIWLREQCTRILINQRTLEWEKQVSEDFVYKMRFFRYYFNNYLISPIYSSPDESSESTRKATGSVILITGEDLLDWKRSYSMNMDKFIKLHKEFKKSETYVFRKGDFIWLYMYEKGVYEDDNQLKAEILSVKKNPSDFFDQTAVTLKIDLNSDCDFREPEFIERTAFIFRESYFFVEDDS